MFKGVTHYLIRTIPANIGVFTLKELIHRRLTKYVKHGNPDSDLRNFIERHYLTVNGLIGGFAGFVIQLMIYPFDYFRIIISNEVKSKSGSGLVRCVKEAIKQRGILGIFNGVTMNVLYMSSARAVYFGLFDSFKDNFGN